MIHNIPIITKSKKAMNRSTCIGMKTSSVHKKHSMEGLKSNKSKEDKLLSVKWQQEREMKWYMLVILAKPYTLELQIPQRWWLDIINTVATSTGMTNLTRHDDYG